MASPHYTELLNTALADIGDGVAVADVTGELYSGHALRQRIETLASLLRSLGLGRGDGLVQLAANRVDAFAIMAACLRAGIRYTPLHPLGSLAQQQFVIEDSGAKLLVVDSEAFTERGVTLASGFPELAVVTLAEAHFGEYLGDLLADRPWLDEQPAGEDIAWVSYTGGTTGDPKGVVHTQAGMGAIAEMARAAWEFPENPHFLASSPISHAAGFLVLPVLMLGGRVSLLPAFSPESVIRAVENEGVNTLFLVPSMIYAILDHPNVDQRDLSNLEHIIYASAPIAPERLRDALHLFGPILHQCYGQTESIHITCMAPHEHNPAVHRRLESAGRATPGMSVSVVDASGASLPPGEVGEIVVSGPSVLQGYWQRPEASAQALRSGWLHTGDVGFMDDAGFLFIVDRLKDMIISGGFNVYSRDVEQALMKHDSVEAAAVVGLPDKKWGECVHALVVLKPDSSCSAEELLGFVKAQAGSLLTPKSLEFGAALPLTNLGKVDKKAIKLRLIAA